MKERKIFEKIVSGGQTGADQGALDPALELGHFFFIDSSLFPHLLGLPLFFGSSQKRPGFFLLELFFKRHR
jgi:hypothetical protein